MPCYACGGPADHSAFECADKAYIPARGEAMSFANFVEANSKECRICKFFNQHPKVREDIDGVLADGKPLNYLKLIADFLYRDHAIRFPVEYVRKHYSRHVRRTE